MNQIQPTERKLVSKESCLTAIFGPDSRPCLRTFDTWKRQRVIPYIKVGRLCFYDPEAVRAALDARFTIRPRSECRA